jgi:hypothetical protein
VPFTRKFNNILNNLKALAQRGTVMRILKNAEDMGRLSGIVEDIRDAMMEYQVGPQVFLL